MNIIFNDRPGITQRRMEREYNDARRQYFLVKGTDNAVSRVESAAYERYRIAAQKLIDVGLLDKFQE